jgi:hypothetical protein
MMQIMSKDRHTASVVNCSQGRRSKITGKIRTWGGQSLHTRYRAGKKNQNEDTCGGIH